MSIKNGDSVRVHYTGTLSDGTEFDSSADAEPLEFVMGSESLIAGFEAALMGKAVGDKFTVTIPAAEAYGEHQDELVFSVPVASLPEQMAYEAGLALQLTTDQGEMDVMVTEVTDETVTLDANHPLAGEDLTFALEVIAVNA